MVASGRSPRLGRGLVLVRWRRGRIHVISPGLAPGRGWQRGDGLARRTRSSSLCAPFAFVAPSGRHCQVSGHAGCKYEKTCRGACGQDSQTK